MRDSGMLFVDCEVNGRVMRAFIDTGAEVTVISAACAERCGLSEHIDRRFAGRAIGVGSATILGRIHDVSLRLGTACLPCSLAVIDHSEMDLLVGLDVLRRYRCDISLSNNSMRFSAAGCLREIAFLTRLEGKAATRNGRNGRDAGGVAGWAGR
ncbi:unnamed protein product, partial [Phaeothamnion confervicola]